MNKLKLIALVVSWLLLIAAIIYMVAHIEELKASDVRFIAERENVECNCWNASDQRFLFVNATTIIVQDYGKLLEGVIS